MDPTFRSGSFHFINSLSYRFSTPQRGDTVGIRLAGRSVVYLTRIVALPGDRVKIKNGDMLVNDQKTLRIQSISQYKEITLEQDQYFVAGDNQSMSEAFYKRTPIFGKVRKNRIIGKVLF